jgi:hypothetical protein
MDHTLLHLLPTDWATQRKGRIDRITPHPRLSQPLVSFAAFLLRFYFNLLFGDNNKRTPATLREQQTTTNNKKKSAGRNQQTKQKPLQVVPNQSFLWETHDQSDVQHSGKGNNINTPVARTATLRTRRVIFYGEP